MNKSILALIPALALLATTSQAQTIVTNGYVTSVGAGTVTLNGGGLLAENDTTFTVNNNIVLGTNGGLFRAYGAVAGGLFGIGAKGDGILVINGQVSGSGGVTFQDGGQMQFNGSNSYTGNTILQNLNGLPSVSVGNVNAFRGSTVVINNFQSFSFTVSGNNTYNFGGVSGSQNLSIGANTLSFGANNQNNTYSGVFSGSGGLVKVGSGTQTLTGNNSFTGGITVNGGTLAVDNLANNANNDITINSGSKLVFAVQDVFAQWNATINPTITINEGGVLANDGVNFNALGAVVLNGGTIQSLGATGANASGTAFGLKGLVSVIGSTTSTLAGAGIALGEAGITSTTFQVTNSATLNVTGNLANGDSATWGVKQTGNLIKTGAGTMILSGTNGYTGTTLISAGTLQVGNGGTTGNLGLNTNTITNNGTLEFNRSDAVTFSNNVTGSGGFSQIGSGSTILTGSNSYTGRTTVSAGTLQLGSLGEKSLSIDNGAGNTTNLLINGGILKNNGSRIGDASGTTGSVTVEGGAWNSANRLRVGFGGTGSLNITGGTVTSLSSDIALNNNSVGNVTMSGGTWNSGSQFIVGGWSNAVGTVSISGGALSNSNGYLGYNVASFGNLAISGGSWSNSSSLTVGFSGSGSLSLSGSGIVSVGNGTGIVSLAWSSNSTGTLNLGNGGSSAGTLRAASVSAGNGTATVNVNSTGNTSLGQNYSGSLSFNHLGSGTTILSGINNYTGGTVINAGTLATSGNERLSDSGTVTVNSSGTFRLGGNETISTLNGAGTANLEANKLTLSSGNFSGALAGSGDLYKTGANAFTISGTSAGFTGDLYLLNGSVVANSSTALNANNFVLLNAGSTFTANQNLVLGGIDQNGGTIDGTGVITSVSTITRSGALNSVLGDVVGYNSGLFKLGGGTTTIGAANTYTGTTKVSEGTLALGGGGSLATNSSAQINSGATLDLAAKNQSLKDVKVNGTIAGTGTMTVTGTLSGSGMINSDTIITGTHTPGNSPGIQTFGGNLTYQPGATMLWQLADNTTNNSPLSYDQVIVGGNLNFNGGTTLVLSFNDVGSLVNWTDSLWTTDQSWTIYQVSGLTSGLNNFTIASASLLDAYGNDFSSTLSGSSFSISQSGKNVVLNYNAAPPAEAIPEPSTYVLFGLGALALVIAYRRKSQQAGS